MAYAAGKRRVRELRDRIPVVEAAPDVGLSEEQARERAAAGYANLPVDPPTKTVWQIIRDNTFTYFNMIFLILGLCIVMVRRWMNLTFMGVVLCNTLIGIVQELRSKRTLDKLNVLSSPKAVVIRAGKERTVPTSALVRDDIVKFSMGDQICADAAVVSGRCQVNEALVTGEADEIDKAPGDTLLSGSFLVSGSCLARLTAVGEDSFASQLTLAAKAQGRRKAAGMMLSLKKLVKWIGIIIIPFGAVMFFKEYGVLDRDLTDSVTSTVASLIGMIPEGLYLLTSLALVAGLRRLAQKDTLCHEMGRIETLARVDTLCVDKTGTITENEMSVEDVVPVTPEECSAEEIASIMADYVASMSDDNDTMAALRRHFAGTAGRTPAQVLPFTSARKYSGVAFTDGSSYLVGAPEMVLGHKYGAFIEGITEYSAQGCRVLALASLEGDLQVAPADNSKPLALLLLSNRIRPEAPDTFAYFARQGVAVKVISGDNPMSVSAVAERAGIPGAKNCVDMRTVSTYMQMKTAAARYTVFGRVTPEQKQRLIRAMREAGHTVAMTGDGVNDVLALKEADCSVAMASGSDVACQVSDLVLMKSDFSAMPFVVGEGRRVINNIERSAALYIVKNIFCFCLAIITMAAALPYPFAPSQLSLVSALTIGIPSFVLALEPNRDLVRGKFLANVIMRALPAALTDLVLILAVLMISGALKLEEDNMSTIATGVMGAVGFFMVYRTSKPLNSLRRAMLITLLCFFVGEFFLLHKLFYLVILPWRQFLVMLALAAAAWPIMEGLGWCVERMRSLFTKKPM